MIWGIYGTSLLLDAFYLSGVLQGLQVRTLDNEGIGLCAQSILTTPHTNPEHNMEGLCDHAHLPRGRKYLYNDAWSNMNTL